MSGFCVFGMTEVLARQLAEKRSLPLKYKGTVQQFRIEHAQRLMKKGRRRQVSATFDAPQFCQDWIDLANKTLLCRDLTIMCRGQKLDADGYPRFNKRTKQPLVGWVVYDHAPARRAA